MLQKLKNVNIKWQLVSYILISNLLTAALLLITFLTFQLQEKGILWTILIVLAVLMLSVVVGYKAARTVQRKLDQLQEAMLEVSKGNFSSRIKVQSSDPFNDIEQVFNVMAKSMEQRVQMLQKLGEKSSLSEQETKQEAIMEERRRLARDLHDTVSQELFAIHMSASSLPKICEVNPRGAEHVMQQLIQMSHHAQKQIRGLISQLRPIELNGSTLEEAIGRWFPEYCRANELQGHLEVELNEPMSEPIEQQLFLIIQEGMANIVKHAAASEVYLSIHELEHQYVMQLQDNGHGFEQKSVTSASHGLATMRERSEKLGGTTEIISKQGAGTRVKVQIPKFPEHVEG
ncbi:histidine kinase [Paenibacillus larvae]|uniref:sensor histidine kinase n=1 Tax=Paenibacillus larvae TaxID=1464 RepID=UPI00227DE115|nr:HAMP domain-containing sensor histidine kinase [Paenibacillus larvae]MCY9509055.1 histidine kinase [Paenibacillus larvae]MCY9526174.1 histidine kinase [Paenibacillus larvae]